MKPGLLNEPLVPLAVAIEASNVLRGSSERSCRRWAVEGVQGPDGRPVRLEMIRRGGRLFTSSAAVERFVEATNCDLIAAPAGAA